MRTFRDQQNLMRFPILLLLLSLISACSTEPVSEKILFSSNRSGNSDIYLMKPDGSEKKAIIASKYEEWGATYMDKNNICFLRQIKDSVFRFQYEISSGKEIKLPKLGVCYLNDKNAVYNKNGDYAFSCGLGLFVKRKNESIFRAISLDNRNKVNYLSWSFDGKYILFTDDQNGSNDVFMVEVDTFNTQNLTNHESNDERGDLSPNGKFLVFSSNRHNPKDQDLYILSLENGKIENITNSDGYDLIGRWSLDGKSIYYGSNKDGNWEIYKYNLDYRSTSRLTSDDGFDGDPRVR